MWVFLLSCCVDHEFTNDMKYLKLIILFILLSIVFLFVDSNYNSTKIAVVGTDRYLIVKNIRGRIEFEIGFFEYVHQRSGFFRHGIVQGRNASNLFVLPSLQLRGRYLGVFVPWTSIAIIFILTAIITGNQ